jgi:hypothetical protein
MLPDIKVTPVLEPVSFKHTALRKTAFYYT